MITLRDEDQSRVRRHRLPSGPNTDESPSPGIATGTDVRSHRGGKAGSQGVDSRQWAEIRLFAESLVGVKAKQVIGKAGLRASDLEDVRQHLLLYLVGRLGGYDQRRGTPEAYATMLITTAVATLLRRRRAERLGCGKIPASLDAMADQERLTDWHLSPVDQGRRLGLQPREWQDATDERLDLADAMRSLRGDLQALAHLLAQGHTVASVARLSGRSRGQVYRDLNTIRTFITRCGLHER